MVDIKGRKSRRIIDMAITGLEHLSHRGACGCEENTGDGAGILMKMPDKFLRKACEAEGIALPEPGRYGAGSGPVPVQVCIAHHAGARGGMLPGCSRAVSSSGRAGISPQSGAALGPYHGRRSRHTPW